MRSILDLIFGTGNPEGPPTPTPMWQWVVLGLVLIVAFRLIFVFVVDQGCTGFMMFAGKIVKSNMKPRYYLRIPFVYYGQQVYLGVQTLDFEDETRSKDLALVVVRGALHFKVDEGKASHYNFEVADPKKVIKELVLSAMRSAVSSQPAADSFEHKDKIATAVMEMTREKLLATVGVTALDVPITEVKPHTDVAASFNAVQAAQRKQDEAKALAVVATTTAQGEADAMAIRAGGQASQLAEQAVGLVEMLSTLTGVPAIQLPPEAALFLMTHFLGMQMRTEFAKSGGTTSMIIPDNGEIFKEMVMLLPALVAHTGVEDHGKADEALAERLEKVAAKDEEAKTALATFKGVVEKGEQDAIAVAIAKLPNWMKPAAKRLADNRRRKAEYGGGVN